MGMCIEANGEAAALLLQKKKSRFNTDFSLFSVKTVLFIVLNIGFRTGIVKIMSAETDFETGKSPYDYVIHGKEVPKELKDRVLSENNKLQGGKNIFLETDGNYTDKRLFPELAGINNNPWYK